MSGSENVPRVTAPVALFAYNRPEHVRRTLASLQACDGFGEGPLTVFCDGPAAETDRARVERTRRVIEEVVGDVADIRLADRNQGLASSIIAGVSELVERHGRVIVLEDDFELAPGFLRYMQAGLDRYADDPRVFQVAAHMYDVPEFAGRTTALLLPMSTTWGWGTWERAWKQFDAQATGWEAILSDRSLRRRFNLDGAFDYATLLRRQMEGRRDSWGIRFYWSMFRASGIALFPPRTLVHHTGYDGSGTHGRALFRRTPTEFDGFSVGTIDVRVDPPEPDPQEFAAVKRALLWQNGGRFGQLVDHVKRLVKV